VHRRILLVVCSEVQMALSKGTIQNATILDRVT
jgi:hypothetical protein